LKTWYIDALGGTKDIDMTSWVDVNKDSTAWTSSTTFINTTSTTIIPGETVYGDDSGQPVGLLLALTSAGTMGQPIGLLLSLTHKGGGITTTLPDTIVTTTTPFYSSDIAWDGVSNPTTSWTNNTASSITWTDSEEKHTSWN
jgi:hypothetical protein